MCGHSNGLEENVAKCLFVFVVVLIMALLGCFIGCRAVGECEFPTPVMIIWETYDYPPVNQTD